MEVPNDIPEEKKSTSIELYKTLATCGLIFESTDHIWNAVRHGLCYPNWSINMLYQYRKDRIQSSSTIVYELKCKPIDFSHCRCVVRSHVITVPIRDIRQEEMKYFSQEENRFILPDTMDMDQWPFSSFDTVLRFRSHRFDTHTSNQILCVALFTFQYQAVKCDLEFWIRCIKRPEHYVPIVSSFLYTCTSYMFSNPDYPLPVLYLPLENMYSALTDFKDCKLSKTFYADCIKKTSLYQFLTERKKRPVYEYVVYPTAERDYLCPYEPMFVQKVKAQERRGGIVWSRPGKGLTTQMLHYAYKQTGKILYIASLKDVAIIYHFYQQSKLLKTKKVSIIWENKSLHFSDDTDDMVIICSELLNQHSFLKRKVRESIWSEVIWDTGLEQQNYFQSLLKALPHIQVLWVVHHQHQGSLPRYVSLFNLYELFGVKNADDSPYSEVTSALTYGFYKHCSYFYNNSVLPDKTRLNMQLSFAVNHGITHEMLYVALREVLKNRDLLIKIRFLELLNHIQNGARCSKKDLFQQLMKFSNNVMPGGKTYNPILPYDRLPCVKLSIPKPDQCIICMGPPNRLVYNVGCDQHLFCYDCMERCIREKSECPLCRRPYEANYYRLESHSPCKKRKVEAQDDNKIQVDEDDLIHNEELIQHMENKIKSWLAIDSAQTILFLTFNESMLPIYHKRAQSWGKTLYIPTIQSGKNWSQAKKHYKKMSKCQIVVTHADNAVYLRSYPFTKVFITGFHTREQTQWIIDKYFMHSDLVVQACNKQSIGYWLYDTYDFYPNSVYTSEEWLEMFKAKLDGD